MSRSDIELYKELCKMRMALRAIALNAPIGSQGNPRLFFPKIHTNSGILRVFAGSP
jgi:hypothetical protein